MTAAAAITIKTLVNTRITASLCYLTKGSSLFDLIIRWQVKSARWLVPAGRRPALFVFLIGPPVLTGNFT